MAGLTTRDKLTFWRPPGPDLSDQPADLAAAAAVNTALQAMSPQARELAFALVVDQSGAKEDYQRYLAVAGVLGLIVGGGLVYGAMHFMKKR
jgi:hypothetical protein